MLVAQLRRTREYGITISLAGFRRSRLPPASLMRSQNSRLRNGQMNTISFILANYVARQLGYQMKQWGERDCALAPAFGAPVLGGSTSLVDSDRAFVVKTLRKHAVKLGYENHPAEKTPQDLLRKIGSGDQDVIGATIDTGWFGTQGYDAAR